MPSAVADLLRRVLPQPPELANAGIGQLMASKPEEAAMLLSSMGVGPTELLQVVSPEAYNTSEGLQAPSFDAGLVSPIPISDQRVPLTSAVERSGALATGDPLDVRPPVAQQEGDSSSPQLSDLLLALRGVQAPPVPEPQRVATPGPPQVQPMQGNNVAALLQRLLGSQQQAPQPRGQTSLARALGR